MIRRTRITRRAKRKGVRWLWPLALAAFAFSVSLTAQEHAAAPSAPSQAAGNSSPAIANVSQQTATADVCEATTLPVIRPDKPFWTARHEKVLKELQQKPIDLVFLGDSIMNNFDKAGPPPEENYQPIWQEFYGDRHALNLGFSGDRTENVLWRLQHGEVEGISPKVVVMMIGTNNTHQACSKWYDVLAGEIAIIDELHERLPITRILLLGIFLSNVNARKTEEDARVNRALSLLYAKSDFVTYLDIADTFKRDGKFDPSLFYDSRPNGIAAHELHPSSVGQRKWVEAIEPALSAMMGDRDKSK